MLEPRTLTAYELGYRAACAEAPRQVLAELVDATGQAWLIGYDDAQSDDEAEWAQMLAGFGASGLATRC